MFENDIVFEIMKYLWLALTAPIAWCVRQISVIRTDVANMKKEYYETSLHASNTYVKHDDYVRDRAEDRADRKDSNKAIHEKLDKIMDKLSDQQKAISKKADMK